MIRRLARTSRRWWSIEPVRRRGAGNLEIVCVIVLSCALSIATADSGSQAVSVDEQAWKTFVQWLSAQPPNGNPQTLLGSYRQELIRRGASPDDATRLAAAVATLAFRRPESVRLLWDKVYAGDNRIFADRPTELLVHSVEKRTPGSALDVGMGQGRNALFLALSKWRVSGFDPSAEGVRRARETAGRLGVTIDTSVTTDDKFDFGQNRWDLIVVTYVRDLTRGDAERFWNALRPGGIVVYENAASTGNEVLNAFMNYRILRWEDIVDAPDWEQVTTSVFSAWWLKSRSVETSDSSRGSCHQ